MTGTSAARRTWLVALALGVLACQSAAEHHAPQSEELRSQLALVVTLELGNGQPAQQLAIEGTWSEQAVRCESYARCLALRLQDAKVSAPGHAADDSAARDLGRLAQQLGTPFLAAYGRDGSLARVAFEPGTHETVQNLLQLVATQLQYVAGPREAEDWIARERDSAGECVVAYHRLPEDPRQVLKQKRQYLQVTQAGGVNGAEAEVRVIESAARHHLDAGGGRVAFEGRETLEVSLGPLSFTSSLDLRLRNVKRTPAPAPALDMAHYAFRPVQQVKLDADEELARIDRRLLGTGTLDGLLAELAADDRSDRERSESLRRRLEALCRLEPASCAALAREVVRRPAAAGLLLGALGMVQSEAAHAGLLQLATDASLDVSVRSAALRYLSRAELSDAQHERLASQLDDPEPRVRAAVRLAYGAVARTVRTERPASARRVAQTLLARLGAAHGADQVELVRALGNAGAEESASALLALARGTDRKLAREAVNALRFVELPEVDAQLETAIRGGEPLMRIAAIEATRFRQSGALLPAIVDAAQKDADAEVRRAALDQLAARLHELPQLREVLVEATRDRDDSVRRTAQRHLDASTRG